MRVIIINYLTARSHCNRCKKIKNSKKRREVDKKAEKDKAQLAKKQLSNNKTKKVQARQHVEDKPEHITIEHNKSQSIKPWPNQYVTCQVPQQVYGNKIITSLNGVRPVYAFANQVSPLYSQNVGAYYAQVPQNYLVFQPSIQPLSLSQSLNYRK